MKKGSRIREGIILLVVNIFDRSNRTERLGHPVVLILRYRLEPVLRLALRVVLVLLFFFFESFTEITASLAFHFGLVPVLAEIGRDVVLVALVVEDKKAFAESGRQQDDKECYRSEDPQHVRKDSPPDTIHQAFLTDKLHRRVILFLKDQRIRIRSRLAQQVRNILHHFVRSADIKMFMQVGYIPFNKFPIDISFPISLF
jgi:hypothetical protein